MAFPGDDGEPLCRLVLERGWGAYGRTAAWLMCNPSRASAELDDPTAGRVVEHTGNANRVRALVGNIWPWRTPYPVDLWPALRDGRLTLEMRRANLDALAMIAAQSDLHVVAYGAEPGRRFPAEVAEALDVFSNGHRRPLYCLGTTDDGHPLHPLARGKLAIRKGVSLQRWVPPA